METKLAITAIAALLIVAVFLAGSPVVTGFFSHVGNRTSDAILALKPNAKSLEVERSIEFYAVLDSYEMETFQESLDIIIMGDTTGTASGADMVTNETVTITDYSGVISVQDDVQLNGTFEQITLGNTKLNFPQKSIAVSSEFTELGIQGIKMEELVTGSGKLSVNGTDISFSSAIISNLRGDFRFSGKAEISGTASSIKIPETGLVI